MDLNTLFFEILRRPVNIQTPPLSLIIEVARRVKGAGAEMS